MYLKLDYCYEDLQGFIAVKNLELYNKIATAGQEDNFNLLIEDKLGVPTPEKLNLFMTEHKEYIKQQLNIG